MISIVNLAEAIQTRQESMGDFVAHLIIGLL